MKNCRRGLSLSKEHRFCHFQDLEKKSVLPSSPEDSKENKPADKAEIKDGFICPLKIYPKAKTLFRNLHLQITEDTIIWKDRKNNDVGFRFDGDTDQIELVADGRHLRIIVKNKKGPGQTFTVKENGEYTEESTIDLVTAVDIEGEEKDTFLHKFKISETNAIILHKAGISLEIFSAKGQVFDVKRKGRVIGQVTAWGNDMWQRDLIVIVNEALSQEREKKR